MLKVFQELTIRGPQEGLDRFIAEVESRLTEGWVRDEAYDMRGADGPMYVFQRVRGARGFSCRICLRFSRAAIRLTNILSREIAELSFDQYNSVVQEFATLFAAPAARELGLGMELGPTSVSVEDYLSALTFEKLASFSRLANRGTPHPQDRKRWNEFLVAAFNEDSKLPPELLNRWLVEEAGWYDETAQSLALEFRHSKELLGTFQLQQAS